MLKRLLKISSLVSFIIFENQFDVGDYVKINSGGTTVAEGTVKSIGLRSTRINTITGELTILPNGSMGEITNFYY